MQSFAGAETTRRFSSILNSTWPMTCCQPKYAACNAVDFTMSLVRLPHALLTRGREMRCNAVVLRDADGLSRRFAAALTLTYPPLSGVGPAAAMSPRRPQKRQQKWETTP